MTNYSSDNLKRLAFLYRHKFDCYHIMNTFNPCTKCPFRHTYGYECYPDKMNSKSDNFVQFQMKRAKKILLSKAIGVHFD